MDINEAKLFTVAQPFKKLGKDELTVDEFTFSLSLDLEWFSPSDAKLVFQGAVDSGLITVSGGFIKPTFDIKKAKKSVGFKPDVGIFESSGAGSNTKSISDKILERAKNKISKKEFMDLLNKKRDKFGSIVTEDVLAILVAKDLLLEIDDLIDEAYKTFFTSDDSL